MFPSFPPLTPRSISTKCGVITYESPGTCYSYEYIRFEKCAGAARSKGQNNFWEINNPMLFCCNKYIVVRVLSVEDIVAST